MSHVFSPDTVKSVVMLPAASGTAVAAMNPWAMVQSMTFKQAMAVLERFGMTPAARTRIAIQPQGDLFDDQPGQKAKGATGYLT